MANFTGRGSGLLDAATKLESLHQGKQEQSRLDMMAASRMQNDEQSRKQSELELQAFQEDRARKNEEYATEQRTKGLLKTANEFANKEVVGDDYQSHLKRTALTQIDAGRELMKTDYKAGLALVKQGQAAQQEMTVARQERFKQKLVKNELAAHSFMSVVDQESLEVAMDDAAKLGIVIPPKYQKFNAETKSWLDRKVNASKAFTAKMKTENLIADTENKKAQAQDKRIAAKAKATKNSLDEQLKRSKMKPDGKGSAASMKADKQEASVIAEQNEAFADLSKTAQQVAVRDINTRALEYFRKGTDYVEAKQKATQEIHGKIKEDDSLVSSLPFMGGSEYESTATGDTTSGSVKTTPKTQSQFVEGKVYKDANGNRAKYVNGKWIPQ